MECFELNFRWLIWLGGRLSNILTGSQSEPTASLLRDQFVGEALLRKEAYPLHKRSQKVLRNWFIGFERGVPSTGSVYRKAEYYIGVEAPEDEPKAEKPFYGPNVWPALGNQL